MDSNARECGSRGSAKPTSGDAESSRATGHTLPAGLTCGSGGAMGMNLLISSAADSPVKTSPSPDDAPGFTRVHAPRCSSSSLASPTLFDRDGSSSRMFPDSFPLAVAAILPSFSRRWPKSGMAWRGECSTLDTSESPSAAVECSLSAILEPTAPSRFYLSSKAARGILRRALKRGKTLPMHLRDALQTIAMNQEPQHS